MQPIFMFFSITFACVSIVFLISKLTKCILNLIIIMTITPKEHRATE